MKTKKMKQDDPVVVRVERRSRNREELSCAEIVRLARQRGSSPGRRVFEAVYKAVEGDEER